MLSFGYGALQDALVIPAMGQSSMLLALVLFAIAIGKIVTTGLTIGSGGSGGVFGPSMVIGGCGGGALGIVLHRFWPLWVPEPSCFVLVGMAGFFAAAAKTPVSTLVIVSEMTGDYSLLLPTLWVCVIAFLLSDEQSIYHSQVLSRSLSPAHQGDYVRDVLTGLQVKDFLAVQPGEVALRAGDRLPAIIERLSDAEGHELPDDRLDRALELFVETDCAVLAVVASALDQQIVGVVRRADISSVYLRRVHGTA